MPKLKRIQHWLFLAADTLSAALLTAMFVAFVIQVVMRYFFNWPVGWTVEVCIIAWIWVILWGQAVTARESDEIRFDIVYDSVSPQVRRVFRVLFSAFLVVVYTMSLPAVWDFVTFMKIEKTSYLDIRFDYVFSVYLVFAVAVIVRYTLIFFRAVLGVEELPPDLEERAEIIES